MSISKPLLDVLLNRTPTRRPVWLMRQAGRYLPEYRKVRERAGSFLKLCYAPEMAAEVTLQPLRRFDLDAAIIFADILVVPHAMGLSLEFVEQEGPVLSTVGDFRQVDALRSDGSFTQFESVCETIEIVRGELAPETALIGFCGAPWTVASYMIEGGGSDRKKARAAAIVGEPWFGRLIEKLVEVSVRYLSMQIEAGAEAVQIFDSWAGDLPVNEQRRWVDEPIAEMVRRLKSKHPLVPVIVFARGVGRRHAEIQLATGCNAVSVEQDVACIDVLRELRAGAAVQGNLDPHLLATGGQGFVDGAIKIVRSMPMRHHIFNLGHGILPQTDPAAVELLISTVRNFDSRGTS